MSESAKGDNPSVLDYRVSTMEGAVEKISIALLGIEKTLGALTTMELRHAETKEALARAFGAIKESADTVRDLDVRLDSIEKLLPVIMLTSGWVRSGVIAVVGLVVIAVVKVLIFGMS